MGHSTWENHPRDGALHALLICGVLLAAFPQGVASAQEDANKKSARAEAWSVSKAVATLDGENARIAEAELTQRGTAEDVPFLTAALQSKNHSYVYYEVLTTLLWKLKDKRAIPALSNALMCGEAGFFNFSAGLALMDLGREDILFEKLNSTEYGIVAVSLNALGKGKSKAAVLPISRLLMNKDPKVRGKAVETLGEIGDPSAIEHIIGALRDEDFCLVRKSAIAALSQFSEKRAIQTLSELLEYKSKWWNEGKLNYGDAIEAAKLLYYNVKEKAIPYLKECVSRGEGKDWLAAWILDDLQESSASLDGIPQEAVNDCKKNYKKYIAGGDKSKIALLAAALRKCDDEEMAVDFLNSNCPELGTAAEYWAYTHGFQVRASIGSDAKGPRWGQ